MFLEILERFFWGAEIQKISETEKVDLKLKNRNFEARRSYDYYFGTCLISIYYILYLIYYILYIIHLYTIMYFSYILYIRKAYRKACRKASRKACRRTSRKAFTARRRAHWIHGALCATIRHEEHHGEFMMDAWLTLRWRHDARHDESYDDSISYARIYLYIYIYIYISLSLSLYIYIYINKPVRQCGPQQCK